LLSSNISSRCPHNMVNFDPLTAEIGSAVWATPANFIGFASWQHYCTASSSGRQPNFAALNRARHLCLAGRPSRMALAHILLLLYGVAWSVSRSMTVVSSAKRLYCSRCRLRCWAAWVQATTLLCQILTTRKMPSENSCQISLTFNYKTSVVKYW